MKNRFILAAALMLSLHTFAQKDELKALKKLSGKEVTAQNVQESQKIIADAESKMANAENSQKVEFYYYKGKAALDNMTLNPDSTVKEYQVAKDSFDKAIELEKSEKRQKYTSEIKEQLYPKLADALVSFANKQVDEQNYTVGAEYFEKAYRLNPTDHSLLYNAAVMAINGQQYDKALEYYIEVDKTGYTGEATYYYATDKEGNKQAFGDKSTRDLMISANGYSNPTEEKIPSKKGEIVRNIALLYIELGETEKAKQAIEGARKANPDDASLIIAQADLYYKTGDMEMYKKLITEATQKFPDNAELFYNLGVVTSKSDPQEAIKLYKRAIEIKPGYVDAYINLAVTILKDEQKIVDQMNSLGNTAADNKKYDQLKKQRDGLYKEAIPYLETAEKAEPDNQYVLSLLGTMYQAVENTQGYNRVKAKIKS